MIGGFQLVMMLRGIIGCRLGDTGLKERLVESDVFLEGTMEKVISGKNFTTSCA